MLANSQMIAINKKGVGTYCFTLKSGLRITIDTDKTIAHTKGYAKSQ